MTMVNSVDIVREWVEGWMKVGVFVLSELFYANPWPLYLDGSDTW